MALTDAEKAELKALRAEASGTKEPTFAEKAGAGAYGAATGFVGGLGELEKFGAYDVPEFLGLREKGERDKFAGRETIFPTVEEAKKAASKIGIKEPREELSGYQTAGEIVGGFGTAIPGIVRGGAKALVGATTKTGEQLAQQAEKLGFKLSPAQVRADVPVPQKGSRFLTSSAEKNQELANELASASTGKKTGEISSEFITTRLQDLGKQFDKVYKGKQFNIDQDAINAISEISRIESQLPGVAASSPVKQVADEILGGYQKMMTGKGAKPDTFSISGEGLQRMRNALAQRARSTSNRSDAHEIYGLIDRIDASIAKNHPEVAAKLNEIRPQYRNTVILEDLYRQGGIHNGNISLERLGNMLKGKRDALRRTGGDIDELGELGKELKLRARWETEGRGASGGEDVLGKVLGTGADIAGTVSGARSPFARDIQRYYAKNPPKPPTTRLPAGVAAGSAVRPFQQQEEY
jgi:hypothetical protein